MVKFAKYEPGEVELRGLHDSALRLVEETAPKAEIGNQEGGTKSGGGDVPTPVADGKAVPPPIPQAQGTAKSSIVTHQS